MAKMDKNDLNIAGFSWDDFRFPPKLFRWYYHWVQVVDTRWRC